MDEKPKWKFSNSLQTTIFAFLLTLLVVRHELSAGQFPAEFNRDSVQFIFQKVGTNYFPAGTCFVVQIPIYYKLSLWKQILRYVPIPMRPMILGINMPYIVTCKHVLFDENNHIRNALYWRTARIGGGIDYAELVPEQMRILTNADASVDIAVMAIRVQEITNLVKNLKENKTPHVTKTGSIDGSLVKNKRYFEKTPIQIGQDMFFVGLFTPFYGAQANIPISRFGRISMTTEEKIPFLDSTGKNTAQDLYVVETQVFGGNSGSPAFFYRNRWRQILHPHDIKSEIYLAGIVKGYFNDYSDIKMRNSAVTPVSVGNVGIGVIVPAYHLYEILFSDDEKKYRTSLRQSFH